MVAPHRVVKRKRSFGICLPRHTHTFACQVRTGAQRSKIFQDYEFHEGLMKEEWRGKILKAEDDNFVNRWLVSHQWKIWVQYKLKCEVETTITI